MACPKHLVHQVVARIYRGLPARRTHGWAINGSGCGVLVPSRWETVVVPAQRCLARPECPHGKRWSSGGRDGADGQAAQQAAMRQAILDGALEHVAQHGWTTKALAMGASAQGLSSSAHGVFTRGPIELVQHFHDKCHAEWEKELAGVQLEGLTEAQKMSKTVGMRLMKQGSVINTWPQALAVQALPSNVPVAITALARTADTACNHASPSAAPVDTEWFRKRMSLGAIYMAAELYMLTDYSPVSRALPAPRPPSHRCPRTLPARSYTRASLAL